MDDIERHAQELVGRHLGGRVVDDAVRASMVEAVAEQLREGFSPEMEVALKRLVDTYVDVAAGRAVTDDNPPTTTEVRWDPIG